MKSLAELGQGYALRRLIPGLSDKPLFGDVEEMVRSIAKMPGQLSAVLRRLESGEISLDMRQREWGAMPSNLRRIGNRLGGALLTAALVVGSSLVYTSGLGPRMWDMPVIGLLGFALSGLLGLYVAFKMFRDT
jgi:ubiquinone biosynthesis protein